MPTEHAPGTSAAPTVPPLPALRPLTTVTGPDTRATNRGNDAGQDGPAQVKSVAKAAKVLRCFTSSTAALTVRDIAARTGLPRSTCHAIATTLVAEHLLETRAGGGYVLGVEMMVMGGHVVARSGLVDAATPVMNRLAASTGSEIHLAQLHDDGHVVYQHRVRVCRRMRARNWFGLRVPAHTTGCGRAALSRLDPRRVRAMVLAHGLTVHDADHLAAELDVARAVGYIHTSSYQPGLASVAAPVLRWDGQVLGAVSVADRRETFTSRRIVALGSALHDAAATITRQLVGPAGQHEDSLVQRR